MIIIWLSLSLSPSGRNSLDDSLTYHVNKNGPDNPRTHCLRPRLRRHGVLRNRTNNFWPPFIINILSPYTLHKLKSSTGKKLRVKSRDWKKKGVFISLICTQRRSAGGLWESGSCFFAGRLCSPLAVWPGGFVAHRCRQNVDTSAPSFAFSRTSWKLAPPSNPALSFSLSHTHTHRHTQGKHSPLWVF